MAENVVIRICLHVQNFAPVRYTGVEFCQQLMNVHSQFQSGLILNN